MTLDVASTFAMLLFGVSVFIFIMLLPALLELKRPKDAGPRMIMKDAAISGSQSRIAALEGADEKVELDQALRKRVTDIIAVLPNLES